MLKIATNRSFQRAASRTAVNSCYVNKQYIRNNSQWSWAESFFAGPKGFGKFYRKPGEKTPDSQTKVKTDSKQKTSKSGGGGGGGGKGWKPPGDLEQMALLGAVAAAATVGVIALSQERSTEITWQEFQTQLLERGLVDKIIVKHKRIASVILREDERGIVGGKVAGGSGEFIAAPNSFGWSGTGDGSGSGEGSFPADEGFSSSANQSGVRARYPSLNRPHSNGPKYHFNIGTVESFEHKLRETQTAMGISPRDYIPVQYSDDVSIVSEVFKHLPFLIVVGLMVWGMRGMVGSAGGGGGPGGIFSIGKSPAKRITKENIKTTFADVAGCDEAKREIMEFVQFLKDSKKFTDLGAKIPRGALLCGPPGTGKTLLAKATAGEANVPFYSISGSDFVEMFVGVGPSRVRDLFKEARENAPCIVFIDEIDAVGRQRGRGGATGGNDERENTLNQMLVEMDGFDSATNVVILAGTNRVDILDKALTRPGRFDRQIQVDRPDIKGRKAIFEIYLKDLTLDGEAEQYSSRMAALTPGFVGADIANICNEAAIVAARRDKKKVDMTDFETATDRIIGGLESTKIMSPEERRVVAYHEAGHAVAGWNLEYADPLLKVTIVPRGNGALGFAQYLPKELFLRTREQILDMVCMALAGRAAEQVNFGKYTTGASDDLRRVTQIVYQMVQVYGMNEKIGQVAFPKEDGQWPQDRMYSNATAEVMDQEVRDIVEEAYERTLKLMEEKKEQVIAVAEMLLEKETITNMDITNVIGKRPFAGNKEYDEYVNIGWKKIPETEQPTPGVTDQPRDEEEEDKRVSGGAGLSPA